MKLTRHFVAKPWGRSDLPAIFAAPAGETIGEIWYEGAPADFPLLAKYLFTGEKLSIQVHPNDAQARERGHASGKQECWYVLDAAPGATIGIGTVRPLAAAELRSAALDGTIDTLIDWRAVAPGDFYYVPAGTVHAIGPGVTMVEIQQAADITYRLYDYGRPRELHLGDAVAVADARPLAPDNFRNVPLDTATRLADGPPFAVQLCGSNLKDVPDNMPLLLIPITGSITIEGADLSRGDCGHTPSSAALSPTSDARLLIAWPLA